MMKMKKVISGSLVALSSLASVGAMATGAKDLAYIGLGYQASSFDSSKLTSAHFSGLKLDAGKYLLPHFAIVTHIQGGNNDSVDYFNETINVDFKYMASVFGRGDIEIVSGFNIYGLLGGSYGKVKARSDGNSAYAKTFSDSNLSYGIGLDWQAHKLLALYGEYVVYSNDSEFEFSGLSLGLRSTF